jgi:hypothetical protein
MYETVKVNKKDEEIKIINENFSSGDDNFTKELKKDVNLLKGTVRARKKAQAH